VKDLFASEYADLVIISSNMTASSWRKPEAFNPNSHGNVHGWKW
jgi:hypothetical protein